MGSIRGGGSDCDSGDEECLRKEAEFNKYFYPIAFVAIGLAVIYACYKERNGVIRCFRNSRGTNHR